MKKMTCAQMGGPCETEIMGENAQDLAANGMAHLKEMHPEMADVMSNMPQEEQEAWANEKWEAATEAEM